MFWIVTATAVETTPDGKVTHGVPIFYLNGDIQGILDYDTCEKVARDVIDPAHTLDLSICVQKATSLGAYRETTQV